MSMEVSINVENANTGPSSLSKRDAQKREAWIQNVMKKLSYSLEEAEAAYARINKKGYINRIRTAEEVLKTYLKMSWSHEYAENGIISKSNAIEFAKEYAKQFIDLAAEEARMRNTYFIDKESILKIKEIVK